MPEERSAQAKVEGVLINANAAALSTLVRDDPATATTAIAGLPPLLVLLRRSAGTPSQIRDCAQLLLYAGTDPNSHTVEWGGEGRKSALFDAVERHDLDLVRLLIDQGASSDEDAFYHACEQSDTAFLDLLHRPGFNDMVNHKLDFEDAAGLRWLLDRGVDVNAHRCLHHAVARGRGLATRRHRQRRPTPTAGHLQPPKHRTHHSLRAMSVADLEPAALARQVGLSLTFGH